MIDCYVIVADSSQIDWRVPVNPGRSVRILAVHLDAVNDGAQATRMNVWLQHSGGIPWMRQTISIPAGEIAQVWVSHNGGGEGDWIEGSEIRQIIAGMTSPWWDDNDGIRIRAAIPGGRITGGRVWLITSRVPSSGDMTRALE